MDAAGCFYDKFGNAGPILVEYMSILIEVIEGFCTFNCSIDGKFGFIGFRYLEIHRNNVENILIIALVESNLKLNHFV
jgi:hypothetical protein